MKTTERKRSEYMFVAPQIVMCVGGVHEYSYSSNGEYFGSFHMAKQVGFDYLDHDDFWVAELECQNKSKKVVALYNLDGDKREVDKHINGINEEFCFE